MITNNGKNVIKQFHARQVPQIGASLAFGVGATAATVNDTRLVYEVIRVPVLSVSADLSNDIIVFRASLPPGQINQIYEVGLWSANPAVSKNMTLNVLGGNGVWTNGTLSNSNARANPNALKIDYVANGTTNAELSGLVADLSTFTDNDSVVVGYHATTNLSNVRVRLGTDASNYYEFVLPAPTANAYNVARLSRATATKTGSPDWSAITYVAVRPTGTAAGAGSIYFDGIRFEENSLNNNNQLVARSVLGTPFAADPDIASDVEYSLEISIA